MRRECIQTVHEAIEFPRLERLICPQRHLVRPRGSGLLGAKAVRAFPARETLQTLNQSERQIQF